MIHAVEQEQELDCAERETAAKTLIEKCGYAAAALTIMPIPGSEIVAVMPIHVGMVVGLGNIYGQRVTRDGANEMILRIGATVGFSLFGSRLATTAAKFLLPGFGGLMGAPFMYASTLAIGAVARAYFASNGVMSEAEMKSVYEGTLKQARQNFDPKRARDPQARDLAENAAEQEQPVARLETLKQLLDKGLIEPAEYEAAKGRVLSSL